LDSVCKSCRFSVPLHQGLIISANLLMSAGYSSSCWGWWFAKPPFGAGGGGRCAPDNPSQFI